MKHNKFFLFLSLIPFLVGCGRTYSTHTEEELENIIKQYDYSVNYSTVHFTTEGHVCGLVAYENDAKYNAYVPVAAEEVFKYDETLEGDAQAEDIWYIDKKRKEFVKKRTFEMKDEDNGGASQTNSCFMQVPLRLYQNESDSVFGTTFKDVQYKLLLDKLVQDEHNGGKIFDVMQTKITDEGITFYSENNYLVSTIIGVDYYLGEVLIRGRFNSYYTYDKNGYLVSEEIKTVKQTGPLETTVNFKVNYTYEA